VKPIIYLDSYLHFRLWLTASTSIDEVDYCDWLRDNADRLQKAFYLSGEDPSDLSVWCRMQFSRAMVLTP